MLLAGQAPVARVLLYSLILCAASTQVLFCQTLDEMTTQAKAVLGDSQFTPEMVSQIKDKASNGDARAQYVLGWVYFIGQGVETNHGKAVDWMTKAANKDYKFAQTQLGLMYLTATDLPDNYIQARQWLLKGAAQGDADALNGLGVIYSQGLGVEVNGSEAVKYFHKAADAGFDMAEYNLGFQYYSGKLIPQDYKEAARLFKLAADQDNVRATYSLGVMYRDGQGVPQDTAEAVRLFQNLAEKRHFPPAEHNLASSYYLGKGVPPDLVAAYMWATLAAEAGFEPSKKLLLTLSEKMTPEQIAEASQKVRDWTKAQAEQATTQNLGVEQQVRARTYLNQGVQAYKDSRFDEAIDDFKRSKELDPSLLNAQLYLATAYATQYTPGAPSADNMRNGELAFREFKEVLGKDPNNLSAIDGLGAILFNMGGTPFDPQKLADSKFYHEKHIALRPGDPEPYYWVGVIDWSVAYRFNMDSRAEYNRSTGNTVKQSDPLPPELLAPFAQGYRTSVDEGISYLKKAMGLKPDYADAMAYLNLLYRQRADMETSSTARDEDLRIADELIDKVKAIKKQEAEASPQQHR